jgi:hypothetical protein
MCGIWSRKIASIDHLALCSFSYFFFVGVSIALITWGSLELKGWNKFWRLVMLICTASLEKKNEKYYVNKQKFCVNREAEQHRHNFDIEEVWIMILSFSDFKHVPIKEMRLAYSLAYYWFHNHSILIYMPKDKLSLCSWLSPFFSFELLLTFGCDVACRQRESWEILDVG